MEIISFLIKLGFDLFLKWWKEGRAEARSMANDLSKLGAALRDNDMRGVSLRVSLLKERAERALLSQGRGQDLSSTEKFGGADGGGITRGR